jgi:hypothetical protein
LRIVREFGEASFEPLKLTPLVGAARCFHQFGIFRSPCRDIAQL